MRLLLLNSYLFFLVCTGHTQRLNGSYTSNLLINTSTLTFNDKKNTFSFSGNNNHSSLTGSGTYTTQDNTLFLLFDPLTPGMQTLPRKAIIKKRLDNPDSSYKIYLHLSENADTSKPVANHSIFIKGATQGVASNNLGNGLLQWNRSRILTVVISAVGYETQEIRLDDPGVYHIHVFRYQFADLININQGQTWTLQMAKDGNNEFKLEDNIESGTPRIYTKRRKRS